MAYKKLFPGALVVVNAQLSGPGADLDETGVRIKESDIGIVISCVDYGVCHGRSVKNTVWRVVFSSGAAAGLTGNVWHGYLDVVE